MSSLHEDLTITADAAHPSATPPVDTVTERRHFSRRAVVVTMLLCVALAIARILLIDGWLRTISIDGPSMALLWKNEHFDLHCGDCDYRWAVDATVGIPPAGWWCPNCGTLQSNPQRSVHESDRLLVDRWPLLWKEPERWDVVALQAPSDLPGYSQSTIKRVVGLPGEEVSILDGDILIDGKHPARRLARWRTTAIVVSDDRFRRRDQDGNRIPYWTADAKQSGWEATPEGYHFQPPAEAANDDFQSLSYVHIRQRRGERAVPVPVFDDDSYNLDPRELEPVRDLALSLWAHVAPEANLELALHDGTEFYRARWSAENREWTLLYGEEKLATAPYHWHARIAVHTEWIRYDGHVYLVINDRLIASAAIENQKPPVATSGAEVARIAASAGDVRLGEVKILRDIHYLPPLPAMSSSTNATWQLGPDEYFVLGDNCPVSIDSRHWPAGSILRDNIWGVIRKPR